MTATEIYNMAIEYEKAEKYQTAFELYQKAAEQGNHRAENQVGYYYNTGKGVEKNLEKAVYHYRKAAQMGNVVAQYNIGLMYQNGNGVQKDYAQAAYWYQKAADSGDADAQYRIGYLYRNGWGVPQDYNKAFFYYKKSADAGNADGLNGLGFLYDNGYGVAVDKYKALSLFEQAMNKGSENAKNNYEALKKTLNSTHSGGSSSGNSANSVYNLGYELYEQKKYAAAFEMFQKASDMGSAPADNMLGLFYRQGLTGKVDYSQALRYYEKARRAGNGYAANNLGVLYENGYGVQKNIARAMELYREAQQKGCPDGTKNLQRLQAQTPPPSSQARRFCAQCGAPLNPGAKWCSQCGSAVGGAPGANASAQYTPPVQRPQSQPVQPSAPRQQSPAAGQNTGNTFLGMLGAIGGAAIAAASIVLIGQLGFISALGGVLLGLLPILGYIKFAGKLNWGGLLFCILLVVVTPYVANQLNMAFLELRYYGEWYFTWDLYGSAEENLPMLYMFTAVGAFSPLKTAIKALRNK